MKIVIIAGPNGAGKTTFAREYLPNEANCPIFINADLIAEGLAPFSPESAAIHAGRLMVMEIKKHVRQGNDFAFETTLSGRRYIRLIKEWRTHSYEIKLIFLKLPDVNLAIERVAIRVQQGGHNVSESIIRRRFKDGWKNFNEVYKNIVDAWVLYENSGDKPVLLDSSGGN